jgi:hypothetical protein
VKPDLLRLIASAVLCAVLAFISIRGLATKRLRSRYGVVITAKERPFSFYTSIGFYGLIACACLFQAIRSALILSRQ